MHQGDDPTVADGTLLYRRIPEHQLTEDADGRVRPSSGAFSNSSSQRQDMSVSLGDTLNERHIPPERLVERFPNTFLASLTAEFVRNEEQVIERSPTPEDPAHGNVLGPKNSSRRKRFARAAEWVVTPPDQA